MAHTNNQKGETGLVQTIMVAALIVAAFFIGMLWTKVQTYENGAGPAVNANNAANTGNSAATAPSVPTKVEVDPITANDYVKGNRKARVALIEYSDLECPFCKIFHFTAKQMLTAYGDKVMWVFRQFPLDNLHSKARSEAAAAVCAGKLGGEEKFWAYIDKIYEITPGNDGLDPAKLPEVAGQIGLDISKFNACRTSKEAIDRVNADYESGLKAGVNGTPGNILFDTKTGKTLELAGAVSFDVLKQKIDGFISSLN